MFQPIVDLRRGVVAGYEALSRFPATPSTGTAAPDHRVPAPPDRWFALADRLGVGAELEALVVRQALSAAATLPADCFLTVNVSPHLLTQHALTSALLEQNSLDRIVVELTEHVSVEQENQEELIELLARLRGAGAAIALDDAGSGYAGLSQIALVRPSLVKLDRAFVDQVDRDEVKLALAELLGSYAGRLDAVLIAEGIEREEELAAFIQLGVPLAQGYLLGRPGPGWATLPPATAELIREFADASRAPATAGSLVERTPTIPDDDLGAARSIFLRDPGLDVAAVVDRHGRPVCLLRRQLRDGDEPGEPQALPVSLRVTSTTGLTDVAGRAMTRAPQTRFDPIACSDQHGRYLGVIRSDRLMLRLAELAVADPTHTPTMPRNHTTTGGER